MTATDLFSLLRSRKFETEHEVVEIIPLARFSNGQTVEMTFHEPGRCPLHIHEHSTSRVLILQGQGVVGIDAERFPYQAGSEIVFPAGVAHGLLEIHTHTLILSLQEGAIVRDNGSVDFKYIGED
jgi:quercetin dioxygenase-like cupin family protein